MSSNSADIIRDAAARATKRLNEDFETIKNDSAYAQLSPLMQARILVLYLDAELLSNHLETAATQIERMDKTCDLYHRQ
jgi:hypothetical protein